MIRAKHFFWHLIKSVFGAAIALTFALFIWVLSTESGLKNFASMLTQQLPGQFIYDNLSGTLLSNIHLDNGQYTQKDGSKITINRLDATPQWTQLILSRIAFSQLKVDHLKIILPNRADSSLTPTQTKTFLHAITLPEWNISDFNKLSIANMAIETIDIKSSNGHDHRFEKTRLSSQIQKKNLNLHFETENTLFHHLKVSADIKGTLQNFGLSLIVSNDFVNLPIEGKGNNHSLSLTLPNTQTEAGTLNFDAAYQMSPPSLSLHTQGQSIDLGKLNPYYQGKIDLDAKINLDNTHGNINLNKLSGTYFQQKIDASFKANTNLKTLTSLDLKASLANDKLFVLYDRHQGTLVWSANITQLASLLPNQSGKIITQGKLTPQAFHASLTGADLTLAQWPLTSLQLNLEGTPSNHAFKAKWDTPETHWLADIQGELDQNNWLGTLHTLNMLSQQTGQWKLEAPSKLTLIDHAITLSPLCWQTPQAQLCASGQWNIQTHGSYFKFKADNLPLEKWSHLLWNNLVLTGEANAHGEFHQNPLPASMYPQGQLTASIHQGTLLNARKQPLLSPFNRASLQLQLTDTDFNSDVNIDFEQDNPLIAHLSIPHLDQSKPLSEQSIDSDVHWQTQALQWLELLDFSKPTGEFNIDLNAKGTLEKPELNGSIDLKNAAWSIPWLNIQLADTALSITAQGDKAKITGQSQSGEGILHIDGTANIADSTLTSQMDLTGENITIENTPNLMLVVSPHLVLSTSNQSLRITGEGKIPAGEIRFQDFSNTVELPEDMTFTHEESYGMDNGTFSHHIALTLGENVSIDTYGIKGLLSGNLILHKLPNRNTMVDGQLHLHKGTYSTNYGINLDIERGILNYTNSPFSSPWLSMTATRQVEKDVPSQLPVPETVGISLSGGLAHLKTNYFARPEGIANQQQILAYLISGRSSGISNAGSNGLVFNALQAYVNNTLQSTDSTQKGTLGYTMKSIKESFNLNEFTLDLFTQDPFSDSNNLEDSYTSLHIGKRLSPKLYAKSNIGMPIGSLTLTYQLAKRWSIQVSSSYGWSHESHPLETGADLFYNF